MKKQLSHLLLCAFLLFAFSLRAQNVTEPGGFRHITVRDGLPSSEVYKIIQDNQGYLWMCTDAGVCRYNGYSFQSFTTKDGLTDNTVFRLEKDNRGRIWALGFSGALSYFDGKKFNGIPANDSLVKMCNNGQKFSFCMDPDSAGGFTIGGMSSYGCSRVGPEDHFAKLHPVPSPGTDYGFRMVWTAPGQHIYAMAGGNDTNNHAGSFFHNGHATKIVFPRGSGSNVMLVTHDNKILFSYGQYLYSIDENGEVNISEFQGNIISVYEDHDGGIWVSMYYGGVVLCPKGAIDKHARFYFPGVTISGVFEDNEKGYWFSTVGSGVYYLPDLNFGYLTKAEGLPETNVQSLIAFGQKEVIVGLPNNIIGILKPGELGQASFHFQRLDSKLNYQMEALCAYHDTILVNMNEYFLLDSSFNILFRSDYTGHAKGLARNKVNGELVFYAPTRLTFCNSSLSEMTKQQAPVRFTAACYAKDGTLWLGALNGLWKMQNEDSQPVYMGNSIKGLNARIDKIVEDSSGILWVATRGEGIYAISGKEKWHFGEADGLAGNTCRTITIDKKGRIWVGTNRGITMISNFNRSTGKAGFRSFNSIHGLLSDEVKYLICQDGKLFMGSNDGLCWATIEDLVQNSVAPPVYITSVLFGTDSCKTNVPAEFTYDDKTIRIFIEGLCFRDPGGLRFKYRLLGGDEQWITTSNREINFSGLVPGNYTLEIFAVNSDGKESVKPAVFSFQVLAPFWRTWWFILVVLAGLLFLVWLGGTFRSGTLQKRAGEKAKTERRIAELRLSALRAQMNPHFIFNAINSIQHFVLKNDSEQAYSYLAKFSRLIRLVLDQSQSESIPLDQELKMLHLYIELEQLRFERPFRYEIRVDPSLEHEAVRIPGMLVQPFVENAIWHGLLPKKQGEALIRISFTRINDVVEIVIEDNGVGREAPSVSRQDEGKHQSYGLQITEERLRLSEHRNSGQPVISITDLKDENGNASGTRVEIYLYTSIQP